MRPFNNPIRSPLSSYKSLAVVDFFLCFLQLCMVLNYGQKVMQHNNEEKSPYKLVGKDVFHVHKIRLSSLLCISYVEINKMVWWVVLLHLIQF